MVNMNQLDYIRAVAPQIEKLLIDQPNKIGMKDLVASLSFSKAMEFSGQRSREALVKLCISSENSKSIKENGFPKYEVKKGFAGGFVGNAEYIAKFGAHQEPSEVPKLTKLVIARSVKLPIPAETEVKAIKERISYIISDLEILKNRLDQILNHDKLS